MVKIVYSFLVLIVVCICACVFYLVNPNDAQYKSYYSQLQYFKAMDSGDINKAIDSLNNPVSIKYHYAQNFMLSNLLISAGRYDEAQKVIESFEKEYDYSHCAPRKFWGKLFCRLEFAAIGQPKFEYRKNLYLSKLYFAKGDYKKAVEYDNADKNRDVCYSTRLLSASGDIDAANKFMNLCAKKYEKARYPRAMHIARGSYLMAQKNYKAALSEFEKDIKLSNCQSIKTCRGNSTTYLYMAQCYKKLGNNSKALEYYNKILTNEPWNYKANEEIKKLKK